LDLEKHKISLRENKLKSVILNATERIRCWYLLTEQVRCQGLATSRLDVFWKSRGCESRLDV